MLRDAWNQLKHEFLLSSTMVGAEVFERGATSDPGQQTGQRMVHHARFKIGCLVEGRDGLEIAFPIQMGRADKTPSLGFQIMGLAQQVGKREPQVEGRHSEMNDLVIEQDQPTAMDENVLGTVVAVNEAISTPPGFLDQTVQKKGCVWDLACGVGVVRFKPERLEKGLIVKDWQQFG